MHEDTLLPSDAVSFFQAGRGRPADSARTVLDPSSLTSVKPEQCRAGLKKGVHFRRKAAS